MSKLNTNRFFRLAAAFSLIALISASCTKNEDSAGYEYTPDMYRSPAVEAYVDYGIIKDKMVDSLTILQTARIPADGSIPYTANMEDAAINMPYPYANSIEGYEQAGVELKNPLMPTDANLAEGKRLYTIFCDHCHGDKGKGDGLVVSKGGHAPPGAYDGPLKDLPVGKMFHTLTFGKGVMGSHASQLSKKERWQVILHVQTLQGIDFSADSTMMTAPMDSVAVDMNDNMSGDNDGDNAGDENHDEGDHH